MLVLDVKRTKEDFLKKKGKSSVRTFKSYTQIFKNTDEQSAIKNWITIQQEERIKKERHLY